MVGLATALGEMLDIFLAPTNLVMLYLLVVLIAALRYGRARPVCPPSSASSPSTSSSSRRATPSP
jgi:K+-sensing histidine kinase KdpD